MNPVEGVKKFLWGILFKKLIKRGVQIALAFLASAAVSQYGIDITGNEKEVVGAVYLALEGLRSNFKTRWPDKFGWL